MKQICIYICLAWLSLSCRQDTEMAPYLYTVGGSPWNEAAGNHRAVLHVESPAEAVMLSFEWRRPDKDIDNRRFLIVNAQTGDTIPNIHRLEVNNERCRLAFGPVKERGDYYFYYLPYRVQEGYGFYDRGYDPKEAAAGQQWLAALNGTDKLPDATIVRVESRTSFDSFYPMEVIATAMEITGYRKEHPGRFHVFPEDRSFPIRMKHTVPYKWLHSASHQVFKGTAMPNEYYAFQLGVWAGEQEVKNIVYETGGLKNGKHEIPAKAITCFNIEGVNPSGVSFTKNVGIPPNDVQPLWFGIDVGANQPPGIYKGIITIKDETGCSVPVGIELKITGTQLADRGDSELWRHSRLRWLNSTLGITDKPTTGYTNLSFNDNRITCLGRSVGFDRQTGLPDAIDSWGNELLASPVRFVIQTASGEKRLHGNIELTGQTEGKITATWQAEDADLTLLCKATMEFDGWIHYIYTISPKQDLQIKDIRLELPLKSKATPYFMGMGLPGQETPEQYRGGWGEEGNIVHSHAVSVPTSKTTSWLWPFDSFWLGSDKAGIHCELRGATYTGPLLNLYRPAYPDSWYNGGKGGFRIDRDNNRTVATVYSGEREVRSGEELNFDFAMLVTPVKEVNRHSQFTDRYYHNGGQPTPGKENLEAGIKIINVHHANHLNPFINYPFITAGKMKTFVDEWHAKGCKVKIYYTIRELTNVLPEIWALRSLGDEILRGGKGGGYPWCQEHFVTGYTPQWYQHLGDKESGVTVDASVLTATGDSRWYNYYVEGLAWMVKNVGIDGLYLDDVAFGRDMLKRMRHAMDDVKPGCIIDLHSNTGFSRGPAMQYAEYFPYVDKVWFGESFMYDEMSPANWLVEVSGIPFGLMGDMLHGGGNKWLGMQYGMTVRQPWVTEGVSCDPRYIWKLWDDFGIAGSEMVGFWEDNPPVTSSDTQVKVTAYMNQGSTLLSIGNYAADRKQIRLHIDWKRLGIDPLSARIVAPAIPDFQEAHEFKPDASIPVDPKRGWLLIISGQK